MFVVCGNGFPVVIIDPFYQAACQDHKTVNKPVSFHNFLCDEAGKCKKRQLFSCGQGRECPIFGLLFGFVIDKIP